ncbi:MAG: hypothetical protein CFH03_01808 [Alphaproteobacteria bacterium MarineAlpha3_Bin2]|nr:MAG: hypothetical protein CFH03_01808 [Alphaproteobacteria bacterium MarineAlpha3_Bin2]
MTSALHQITMSFLAEDDRLLMRVSTTDKNEFHFLLTRRFVNILWPALMTVIEKEDPASKQNLMPGARKAVTAMKHQEAIAESNFSQTHDEDTKQLTPNPLLVTGGTVNPGKQGVTGLTFKTQGGAEIKISLNKTLLHALCRLLIETTMKADWDLGLVVGAAAGIMVPEDKTQIH